MCVCHNCVGHFVRSIISHIGKLFKVCLASYWFIHVKRGSIHLGSQHSSAPASFASSLLTKAVGDARRYSTREQMEAIQWRATRLAVAIDVQQPAIIQVAE